MAEVGRERGNEISFPFFFCFLKWKLIGEREWEWEFDSGGLGCDDVLTFNWQMQFAFWLNRGERQRRTEPGEGLSKEKTC